MWEKLNYRFDNGDTFVRSMSIVPYFDSRKSDGRWE